MRALNRLSAVLCLRSFEETKGDLVSKSQKLFSELKLVRFENGFGTLLPIMMRSLRKLEGLIRKEMESVSAHEILLPSLTDMKLLQKTGRDTLPNLFKLEQTNNKSYFLNSTCEEAAAHLLSTDRFIKQSYLPYRFYQISSKFRDEKRTRSGLLRGREFIMKDLYTFDANPKLCLDTYEEINEKYHDFFQKLKLPYVCIKGSEEDIKSLNSNEFHIISEAGGDELIICQNCGHANGKAETTEETCQKCSSTNIKVCKSIEIAHTFHLGTKYTEPINAFYKKDDESTEFLHMNSFGIGVTRLLAASVEVLCQNEQIRWPIPIAPYLLCLIPPKAGSKEEAGCGNLTELVFSKLKEVLQDDIVVDDRLSLTVGKRLNFIKALGIPYIVILGKQILNDPPMIEVQDVNANTVDFVQTGEISQFIVGKLSNQLSGSPSCKKESLAF